MRWKIKPIPEVEKVDSLAKALNVEKPIAHLLVQRGIETFEDANRFFRPKLEDLHDPYLMKDMDKAVARIEKAIENNENILVYGDYDVDGTTSVALVSEYLKTYYPNVFTYIPDRYDEGYGVSFQGIDFAHDNNFSLIITLDCGIKAVEKVAYASEKNIDFVICDHHTPGKTIPDAVAVLDPKRDDCEYPYKELCGCGVGFKLIQALADRKSTRLNSSHVRNSYAVFCLKKKLTIFSETKRTTNLHMNNRYSDLRRKRTQHKLFLGIIITLRNMTYVHIISFLSLISTCPI